MSPGIVESIHPPRFFCAARWRCARCLSPWFGARTVERAYELLAAHVNGCRG